MDDVCRSGDERHPEVYTTIANGIRRVPCSARRLTATTWEW